MRLSFQAGLLLLALAVPILAQDDVAILKTPQETVLECTEELFEKAEKSFRKRRFGSEMLVTAERQLSKVVRLCKGTPGGFQAEDHLRVVHEDLARLNLSIARFYLSKFYHGKGGKEGARSRLKSTIERYPHYSRLDEVLLLLGNLYRTEGNLGEAATCYRRLITAYPGSQYAAEASLGLTEIEVLKINGSSKPRR